MGYYEDLSELDINEGLEDMQIFRNSVLVDVRTPEEYAEGHVPGAINIEDKLLGRKNQAYVESILTDKTAHIHLLLQRLEERDGRGFLAPDGLHARRKHRRVRRVHRSC